MKMENIYYLPIKTSSLAHYFGSACIKAAKYFDNKLPDLQDKYEDAILLTNKRGCSETDCCLELVLTDNEVKELVDVKGGWFLFDAKPLPITRVKKIYFSDNEKMANTITDIAMSTAYVPKQMVELCRFESNSTNAIQLPPDFSGVEQREAIERYDRYLGAMALMRLAHEPYMNYSQNYFSTLSLFNSFIAGQVKLAEDKCNRRFNSALQGIFKNSNGFEKVLPYLNKPIDEESLNKIARENKQEIKKDLITRKIDLNKLTDTWTYTIAVLNAYGVGDEARKMRVDGLVSSHFSELKEEKSEGVALCYGYNRGYSVFGKEYSGVAFKYRLNSQLDYYTIESIYQYVFNNGMVSNIFPYLDSWCPKLPTKQAKKSTDYMILDELVIGKKKAKVFSPEWWNGYNPFFKTTFALLAEPIFEKIKEFVEKIIYPDIEEAYQDKIDQLDSEYSSREISLQKELNDAQEKVRDAERQISELKNSINKDTHHSYSSFDSVPKSENPVVAEPQIDFGTADEPVDTELAVAVSKYKDYTLKQLKSRTKVKDDATLGELLKKQNK